MPRRRSPSSIARRVGQAVAPATSEGEFRAKLSLALREKRDAEIDKLRKKYAPKLATLQDQIRRANERVERERSDLSQHKMQAAISVGTSILGALLGRKAISVGNAQRVGSAARSAGRIGKESGDVGRAEENREVLEQRFTDLQNELETEVSRLRGEFDPATVQIEQSEVKPRKADIDVRVLGLCCGPERRSLAHCIGNVSNASPGTAFRIAVRALMHDVLGDLSRQQRLRRAWAATGATSRASSVPRPAPIGRTHSCARSASIRLATSFANSVSSCCTVLFSPVTP